MEFLKNVPEHRMRAPQTACSDRQGFQPHKNLIGRCGIPAEGDAILSRGTLGLESACDFE